MKIKLVFKIICFSSILLLSTKIQAQKTKKSYLDIIDYWKKESYNKKVKEITSEHTEYETYFGRDKNSKKIKNYTKSKQIFNKFGCLVSQINQVNSYSYIGSKSQNTHTRINYEYDNKYKLLKEKIYTNLDTITLKPIDTSDYSLKVYHYNINEPLKECLEYNNSKVLIKKTTFIIDTLKHTLEITDYNLKKNNEFQFKTIHQFDDNSVLIQQTYFQFGKMSGINIITYDEKVRKSNATLSSTTSHYKSSDSYKYDSQNFLIEHREGSNTDPGTKKYFNYTFDINKNWLTKEIKNDTGIIIEHFKRKISYFK